MIRFEKIVSALANKANSIAAIAVVVMMVLTVADVILRFFRMPIPGTYETVGLLGAVVISFSLGYTSIEKGHIAVDFLVERLPEGARLAISVANNLIAAVLFAVVSWQSMVYALGLKEAGEVSLTLQLHTYPFVMGIAIGCALLSLVLTGEFFLAIRGVER
ncbi:MAG TPA: TRAP transporter small permease [Spirochaetota bacterium]|nr:TRAP transporter small permease [Spirochaetota bacterium]HPI90298.1 TRAP transporter small permease [Spirochaetota bacterium]HPR49312.1 TRAP transporter small permease [Spirochaetota bacterium]